MARITYEVKGKKLDLDNISTNELLYILRRIIAAQAIVWRERMLDGKDVDWDAIERGPIHYAEDQVAWMCVEDVLDKRDITWASAYHELQDFSYDCAMGRVKCPTPVSCIDVQNAAA